MRKENKVCWPKNSTQANWLSIRKIINWIECKTNKMTHWLNIYKLKISRNYKGTVRHRTILHNKELFLLSFYFHLRVQGQMAQRINVVLNSIPSGCRDLAEFAFFCGVGFTFGSLGLIWNIIIGSSSILFKDYLFNSK